MLELAVTFNLRPSEGTCYLAGVRNCKEIDTGDAVDVKFCNYGDGGRNENMKSKKRVHRKVFEVATVVLLLHTESFT
jgi:hypothetical protein